MQPLGIIVPTVQHKVYLVLHLPSVKLGADPFMNWYGPVVPKFNITGMSLISLLQSAILDFWADST